MHLFSSCLSIMKVDLGALILRVFSVPLCITALFNQPGPLLLTLLASLTVCVFVQW